LSLSAQSIANGTFAQGLTSWTPNAPAKISVTGDAASPQFLRMTFDSSTTALFATQEVTGVEAGVRYTFGVRMRLGAPAAAALLASVRTQYLDGNGTLLGSSSEAVETGIPGTSWLYYSTTMQAPANATKLRAWLRVEKKPSDATPAPWQASVDFDDAVLARQIATDVMPQTAPSMLAANGNFLVGDQPIFPIGVYSIPPLDDTTIGTRPELFAALRAHGFNAVRSSKVGDVNSGLRELKAASEAGLMMNFALYVPEQSAGGIRYSVLDTLVRSPWAPALLAWNTADEPNDHADAPEAGLELAYREYRRLDGNRRPILLTLTRVQDYWSDYFDAADAFVATDYPRPWGNITDPRDTVIALQQQAGRRPWQHSGAVLQLGWSPSSNHWGYPPTPAQARAMAYGAMIGGAQSIWWYALHVKVPDSYTWYATQSDLWPAIKSINEEITRVSGPLLTGTREPMSISGVSTSGTGSTLRMQAAGIRYQHGAEPRFYILATNITPLHDTLILDDTNRCLGTADNAPAAAIATFTIPAKVVALAEPASNVTWTYEPRTNTTEVTATFAPLESRTIVLKVGSPQETVLEP
jgi:hypothetical protein